LHATLDYDREIWEVLKILESPSGAGANNKILNMNPLFMIYHIKGCKERSILVQV
jgi:hypothetical protein